MRKLLLAGAAWVLSAGAAYAEDSADRRWYAGIRYDLASVTDAHDFISGQLGVNFNRYLGAELVLDSYELKVGELSELSVIGVTPQLRLRYPFLKDRLVPYLVGGVGLAITQANDQRLPVEWEGGKNGLFALGTIGGGLEYFIADNIALGWEVRQVISGTVDYQAEGGKGDIGVGATVMGLGVRVLYPQLHPPSAPPFARFYLDLRTGGALLATNEPFHGVTASPEQSIGGGNFSVAFGTALGVHLGRYASIEVVVDNYELSLAVDGVGRIGEYAVFPVLVQSRLRYPLLDGRLEPHVMLGVGGELGQPNDLNQEGLELGPDSDIGVIGAFGTGAEYYLMDNFSLGLQAKYIVSRGHELRFDNQPPLSGNLDSFLLFATVRVVFAGL